MSLKTYTQALDVLKKLAKYGQTVNGFSMCATESKEAIELLQKIVDIADKEAENENI